MNAYSEDEVTGEATEGSNGVLSPENFWEAMCDPGFVRLGLRHGELDGVALTAELAPEEVPGFLESKLDRVVTSLRLRLPKSLKQWPWRKPDAKS